MWAALFFIITPLRKKWQRKNKRKAKSAELPARRAGPEQFPEADRARRHAERSARRTRPGGAGESAARRGGAGRAAGTGPPGPARVPSAEKCCPAEGFVRPGQFFAAPRRDMCGFSDPAFLFLGSCQGDAIFYSQFPFVFPYPQRIAPYTLRVRNCCFRFICYASFALQHDRLRFLRQT